MIDFADLGNATFEMGGAVLSWMNVRQLFRDKGTKGVYIPAWAFFAVWGIWNIFYYGPNLGQWWSWGAGWFITSANVTWLVLAIRYRRQARELEGLRVRADIEDL